MWTSSERCACISVAVWKPKGTIFDAGDGVRDKGGRDCEKDSTFCNNLVGLLFGYAFNGDEMLARSEDDGFDGVETCFLELLDVVGVYTRLLQLAD